MVITVPEFQTKYRNNNSALDGGPEIGNFVAPNSKEMSGKSKN